MDRSRNGTPLVVGSQRDKDAGNALSDADDTNPETLFVRELSTIDRAIRFACRRGGMQPPDADDFASYVKLKLIDDGYAIIRKYQRRSTFSAFISIVVQRLLLDYRISQWGKWHASAMARRLGEPAITIEALLFRDGRTIDEILPSLIRRWPDLTRQRVETISTKLPARTARPRPVDIDYAREAIAPDDRVDDVVFASHWRDVSSRIEDIVRATTRDLDDTDRLIFRLRFEGGMSVADISRTLRIDQKPVYRQLQRMLVLLRVRLEAAGITAADAASVLASRHSDLDFGFLYTDKNEAQKEERE